MTEDVVKRMVNSLICGVLVLVSLSACATLPKSNPGMEARLDEANAALDRLSVDINAFYENLEVLLSQIKALSGHPGWIDMEAIIAVHASNDQPESEASTPFDLETALDDWTARWGDPGESMFLRSLSLIDLCSASEARRIGLIGRLASLQAAFLEVTLMELSANRYSRAKAIFETVDALSKSEDELNSFTLNAIGLYEVEQSG